MTVDPYDEYDFNPGLTHSSASGLRRQWYPAFSAVIEDRMESIAKKPRRREVIQFFNNDKVLRSWTLSRKGQKYFQKEIQGVNQKQGKRKKNVLCWFKICLWDWDVRQRLNTCWGLNPWGVLHERFSVSLVAKKKKKKKKSLPFV